MAIKKYLSLERLTEYDGLIKTKIAEGDASIKSYVDTEVAKKADSSHTHSIDDITNLQSSLNGKADASHEHSIGEISGLGKGLSDLEIMINNGLSGKADATHNHDNAYDAKGSASTAEANAKAYADGIKNDLLNGAGAAYDTLKELGDLIDDNQGAIDALETIAAGKADAEHAHPINLAADTGTSSITLAGGKKYKLTAGDSSVIFTTPSEVKVNPYNTDAEYPIVLNPDVSGAPQTVAMGFGKDVTINPSTNTITATTFKGDLSGNATSATSATSATKATQDASGNTITSTYATKTELNTAKSDLQTLIDGKANSTHSHDAATTSAAGFMTAAMVTKLNGIEAEATKVIVDSSLSSTSENPVQNKVVNSALVTATNAIQANATSISAHTTSIAALETKVGDGFAEITSAEISALFA